jgi:hypothetical protein
MKKNVFFQLREIREKKLVNKMEKLVTCSRHRNLQNIQILQVFCYDFFA